MYYNGVAKPTAEMEVIVVAIGLFEVSRQSSAIKMAHKRNGRDRVTISIDSIPCNPCPVKFAFRLGHRYVSFKPMTDER